MILSSRGFLQINNDQLVARAQGENELPSLVGHHDLPGGGGVAHDGGVPRSGWEHSLICCSQKSESSEDFSQSAHTFEHL